MSKASKFYPIFCGITLPIISYSAISMAVFILSCANAKEVIIHLSALLLSLLSAVTLLLFERKFKAEGSDGCLSVAFFLCSTVFMAIFFSFSAQYDFSVAFGLSAAAVQRSFRISALTLCIVDLILLLKRIIIELVGYIGAMKK